MGVIDNAVEWAIRIAEDPAHGYDQIYRWGERGDYDCSSLVISAFKQAGVPLSCTYTGNMKQDMIRNGFKIVTDGSRQKGDILLNEQHHTAMMIDGYRLVQASQNELGGIAGGMAGDQTGGEINIRSYYDFPWDCVLRYSPAVDCSSISDETPTEYVVQGGDTLYHIAEIFRMSPYDIARWNGLTDPNLIFKGSTLKLYDPTGSENPSPTDECADCLVQFPDEDDVYTVVAGDTLSGIAYRRYGRWSYYDLIKKYNGLTPDMIIVGQKLKLPPLKELLKMGVNYD